MSVYVDTSALLAVLDEQEERHAVAHAVWLELLDGEPELVCSSHTQLETFALAQNRLGVDAVRVLDDEICPALTIEWVTKDDHRAAVASLLAANRRQLSLVDCASFTVMRRLGVRRVFAFDPHFQEFGFGSIPDGG